MKKYLPILISIMIFSFFLAGQVAFDLWDLPALPSNKEKKKAMHYETLFKTVKLKDQNNKVIELAKIKSPVVILNFWATWCGPCIRELPDLVKLDKKFDDKKLKIIGINTDDADQLKEIKSKLKEYSIKYSNVLDPDGVVLEKFLISAIPVTIIYHNGKMVKLQNGPMDFMAEKFLEEIKSFK